MSVVKKIKKLIKKIPGVKPLLRYERPGFGTVYMLHRVCPHKPQALYPNENLKVSPEFLEKFIIKKQKKYDFISLDSLADMLTSQTGRTNEQTNKRTNEQTNKRTNEQNRLFVLPLMTAIKITLNMPFLFLKNTRFRMPFTLPLAFPIKPHFCGGLYWIQSYKKMHA